MEYKIESVYAISTMMNINIDIEILNGSYNYNAEWDYKERYATITNNDTGNEVTDEYFDTIRDAVHSYLTTVHDTPINRQGSCTKLGELMDEIKLEC